MQEKTKKRISVIAMLAAVLAGLLIQLLLPGLGVRAEAADEFYTDVLDDLRKDAKFQVSDYPIMTLDYYLQVNQDDNQTNNQPFLEVIQIAESRSGELYIYVYQPTDSELDLKAKYISLSTEFTPDGNDINPKLYELVLVSDYGVFDKYVVKDFAVSQEPDRYYNIVMLLREFSDKLDSNFEGTEEEGNYVRCGVGQQWYAHYVNNSLLYEMNTFSTVETPIVFTGNIDLREGFTFGNFAGLFDYNDLWFVVFNVEDYIVSRIYDGDVSYKEREIIELQFDEDKYGEWSEFKKVTLNDVDDFNYEFSGIAGTKFTWKSIYTSDEFIKNCNNQSIELSNEAVSGIKKGEYVFTFAMTERKILSVSPLARAYTDISGVTVMRLHFMDVSGNVYNLGAVSDMVNPDNISDGKDDPSGELIDILKIIVGILLLIVLFIFIYPFVKPLIDWLYNFIFDLISSIFKLILFPFVWIAKLFNKKE